MLVKVYYNEDLALDDNKFYPRVIYFYVQLESKIIYAYFTARGNKRTRASKTKLFSSVVIRVYSSVGFSGVNSNQFFIITTKELVRWLEKEGILEDERQFYSSL